jgi:hypothetical protein
MNNGKKKNHKKSIFSLFFFFENTTGVLSYVKIESKCYNLRITGNVRPGDKPGLKQRTCKQQKKKRGDRG